MKKILFCLLLSFTVILGLTSCGNKEVVNVDYDNVVSFESDLNNGEDLTGKIVIITVDAFVPNSAFGYNIQNGEHLNWCSQNNPKVQVGEKLTVKVTEIRSLLGSYIIYYEIV